jgi:hypothetical protein
MKQFVGIPLIAILLLVGCVTIKPGYFSDDKKLAIAAAEEFHRRFNSGEYHDIFESTHPEAKATKTEARLVEVLSELRSNFGTVKDSRVETIKVSILNTKERSVEMVSKTQHEQGARNEIFLFITNGEKAQLHTLGVATDAELVEIKKKHDSSP